MKKAGEIFGLLGELLDYYEYYLMKHNTSSLNIIIEHNAIGFYLDGETFNDELIISFDEKERSTFKYLAIKVIIKLFGHVVMHLDNNTLYNNVHKKNIKIDLLDEEIKQYVENFISIQDEEFINDDLAQVRYLAKKANKMYPDGFVLSLKRRIEISKKVIKKEA